jgi:hypothetical protein
MFFFRRYGENRILTEEYGDMGIRSFDLATSIVIAYELKIGSHETKMFQLVPGAKSSRTMYRDRILKRWAVLRERWVNDDDFLDFFPAIFDDLNALSSNSCEIFDGTFSFHLNLIPYVFVGRKPATTSSLADTCRAAAAA